MTALGIWLKQLIMMVLLAVFAELLLPTKSMQKYVRAVLGLGIIAVILTPVVPLLSPEWANQAANLAVAELGAGNGQSVKSASATTEEYAAALTDEQQSAADEMVQNELDASLPADYRPFVKSIIVTGAATGTGTTHVTISRISGSASSSQIQSFAANLLGIPDAQVTITN
jgi:stage III sporulation protein AF